MPAAKAAHTFQFVLVGGKDGDQITWDCNAAVISPLAVTSLPPFVTRTMTPYSQTNTVYGGVGPYTFSVVNGTVPAGTHLVTTPGDLTCGTPAPAVGTVCGVPTAAAGTAISYTIRVTDSESSPKHADGTPISGTLDVAGVAITSVAPTGTLIVGGTYSQTNTATGGVAPIIYTLSGGALPPGTQLNPGSGPLCGGVPGTVCGTPTTPGAFSYTIRATDATMPTHLFADGSVISGTITAGTLALNVAASAVAKVGSLYQQTSSPSGGSPIFTYSVVLPGSGPLPAGTSLDPITGTVTGGPTTAGPFSYTLKVTDQAGATATKVVSGTILPADLVLTSTNALVMVQGANYAQGNVATGGTGGYVYSVVMPGSTLPTGTTLDPATGTVSGTATAAGTFTYTIRVTDSSGATKQNTITAFIAAPGSIAFVLNSVPSATQQVGVLYSQQNVAAGGTPFPGPNPYVYSLFSGATPAGTTLNPTNGTVSGTPTVAGGYTYVVEATDNSVPPKTAFQTISGNITQGNATSLVLTSSLNPSDFGQSVTFTAVLTEPVGAPTGTITFKDGTTVLAIVPMVSLPPTGSATFTTSALTVGTHIITATYNGDANFNPATSNTVAQVVKVPLDSQKLRALQIAATKLEAQASAHAITGAIENAINDGFAGIGAPIVITANGAHFNFFADDPQPKSAAQRFDWLFADGGSKNAGALGYAAGPPAGQSHFDAVFGNVGPGQRVPPPAAVVVPPRRDWMMWGDITWTGIGASNGITFPSPGSSPDLSGKQFNFLVGLSRIVSPVFLVGVVGGFETFDYTSETLSGKLTGNGWTGGTYAGWKFLPGLRLDGQLTYSNLGYDGSAGKAAGSFQGHRVLASTSLNGSYWVGDVELAPVASVYALWEHEDAYSDTLGILQGDRSFMTGRVTMGGKIAPKWDVGGGVTLTPYVGAYADYHWTADSAEDESFNSLLTAAPLLDGVSARVSAGWGARLWNGSSLTLGGELGGLGSHTEIWSVRALGSVPF